MGVALIILGVLLVCAGIVAFYVAATKKDRDDGGGRQSRRDPFLTVDGAAPFSPSRLGPGAIVSYGGVDYIVRATLRMQEGPYVWFEHLLDGGDGAHWLGAEIDEGQLNLSWWTSRKDLRLEPKSRLTVDGVDYREIERGHAEYTLTGDIGMKPTGTVRYVDYQDADGQRLLGLEGYGAGQDAADAALEVSLGRPVLPGELTVYPKPEDAQ